MSFTAFQFHPQIAENIAGCGYTAPTPIQEKAISPILSGRDVLGLAQTGTGKTAAFVLPILQRLLAGQRNTTRAVIIAPTRELAEQIHENVVALARKTGLKSVVVYGGVGKQPQLRAIRSGAEIIVACPGRLLDILSERGVSLNNVEAFVLDEADHMFDKGFLPDIRRIIKKLPIKRQNLVFSATMPKAIRHLADELLVRPCTLQINHTQPAPTISHSIIQVAKAQKTTLLKRMLKKQDMTTTLVFTRTKYKAKNLAVQLQKAGYSAVSLQGNLSQQKRKIAMDGFRDGKFNILVATDIAARGIDVSNISHVINYDVPDTAETYTHRTGRTGRAKQSGRAITFADQGDRGIISVIERNLGSKMHVEQIDPLPAIQPKKTGAGGRAPKADRKAVQVKQGKQARRGGSRRSKSSSFDSGINTPSKTM